MKISPFVALAVGLLLCGCGSVSVKSVSDDNFHAAKYKTFGIKKPSRDFNPAEFTPENQDRVRAAITEELRTKGLQPAENPDLWIAFYLRVQTKRFDLDHPTAQGDSMADIMKNHYGFVYGSGKSLNQQQAVRYQEGSLVVDAVDAKANRIVWQGTAQGAMHQNTTDEGVENRIKEAVHKIFTHFH